MECGLLTTQKPFGTLKWLIEDGTDVSIKDCDLIIFSARINNPVGKRTYTALIKPGYMLMQDADYLNRHYNGGTMHSKLLRDFTGKDQE